jgi:outer membrane protein assembly factor BamB
MSDRSIEDLLGELPPQVTPDPDFEARLRRHLTEELGAAGTTRTPIEREPGGSTTTEVIDLEATTSTTIATKKGSPARWLRVAAVAAVVAVGAAVAAVAVRDDGESTSASAPDATFVGAELEPIALTGLTPNDPYFVAAESETWVLSLDGDLTRIDATGTPELVAQVPKASPIAVDEDAVWIADAVDGRVLRLDPADGSVVAEISTGIEVLPTTFRIPMPEGASQQFALIGGIATDGDAVWVGDKAGRVLRIDPATNEVDDSFDVPVRPDQLQVVGDQLLVVNVTGGEVAVVDSESGDLIGEVEELDSLAGAALHAGVLYLQDAADGTVTRIDLESGDEHSSAPLGASLDMAGQPVLPTGPVATADGVLVATAAEPDSVLVLDPTTLRQTGTLAVEADHGDMTVAPDGSVWLVRGNAQTVVHITPRPL